MLKRRLIALLLCICMLGSMTVYATDGETEPTTEPATVPTEVVETEPAAALTYFEEVMAAESVEDMYIAFCADQSAAAALTVAELDQLIARATELKETVGDPSGDYDEFVETLNYLKGELELEGNPEALGSGKIQGTVTGTAFMDARDANNTVQLTSDTTLTSYISIAKDQELVIDLNGYALISNIGTRYSMVYCDGTLTVKSSNMTREHKGTMEKVTYWLDKRANHSKYGKQYDNNSYYYDRYAQVTTETEEIWTYDGKGSTVIKGGVITGGRVQAYGGAIYVRNGGVFNFESGTIAGNSTSRNIVYDPNTTHHLPVDSKGKITGLFNTFGGAVYVSKSTFNMKGGTICYNFCDYYGGGVCLDLGSVMNMTSGVITNNCAQGSGGGIGVRQGSTLNLGTDNSVDYSKVASPVISYNKTFDTNYTGGGGGIEVTGSTLNYKVGSVTYNRSSGSGGGIYCYRGGSVNASTANSIITNNYSGGTGGGIFLQYGDVNLNGVILSDNTSARTGGAVGIRVGNFNMTGGVIRNNTAASSGGAVSVTAQNNTAPHADNGDLGGSASLVGTLVEGNKSNGGNGGALYVSVKNSRANVNVTVEHCEIRNNSAAAGEGGAIYLQGGTLTVKGDSEITNNTARAGGAFYVLDCVRKTTSAADFRPYIVDTAKLQKAYQDGIITTEPKLEAGGWWNVDLSATVDGKTTYFYTNINDTKPGKVIIESGTISNNTATQTNGGVMYVSGAQSSVEVKGGTLMNNTAKQEGGVAYVDGGSVTVSGGEILDNTAVNNGGALSINGGNFTMTSGKMIGNKATAVGSCGGGVYVRGGNIVIGQSGCSGDGKNHSNTPTNIHPQIMNNSAVDSGGGIALIGNGNITMYCGSILKDTATNAGRGKNIYMENGIFTRYAGILGDGGNPDLVIVGGKLVDKTKDDQTLVTLHYEHCNAPDTFTQAHTGSFANKEAQATNDATYNLPDGEKYWTAPSGYRFLGWTFYGPTNEAAKKEVRTRNDYEGLGTEITIRDGIDNSAGDGTIYMYALWAPDTSKITYVGSVINGEYTNETLSSHGNPVQYNYTIGSNIVNLKDPVKAGYTFKGWYIYQDLGKNANWGYEPAYKNGTTEKVYANLDFAAMKGVQYLSADANGSCNLDMGNQLFGDITLIADFDPAFTDLTISKAGWDSNNDEDQAFIFKIEGTPYDVKLGKVELLVTIKGNGSVKITNLPIGKYKVTEMNDWSWRYADHQPLEIELSDSSKTDYKVTFNNSRLNRLWLSGDNFIRNLFK